MITFHIIFSSLTAAADKQQIRGHYQWVNRAIYYLKLLGWWNFTLHELIIFERIEMIERRISLITVGKKAQPALLNQYNAEGPIIPIAVYVFLIVFLTVFLTSVFLLSSLLLLIISLSPSLLRPDTSIPRCESQAKGCRLLPHGSWCLSRHI